MRNREIEEAIENIKATSKALEKFCNDPKSSCNPDYSNMLEQLSWELEKQANDLEEMQYLYGA